MTNTERKRKVRERERERERESYLPTTTALCLSAPTLSPSSSLSLFWNDFFHLLWAQPKAREKVSHQNEWCEWFHFISSELQVLNFPLIHNNESQGFETVSWETLNTTQGFQTVSWETLNTTQGVENDFGETLNTAQGVENDLAETLNRTQGVENDWGNPK